MPNRNNHPRNAICLALLLLAYAVGLFRQVDEPWIRLHDWNGAFYSQLARNALRYPFEMHHGMPLVAMGANVPPNETSIYATHPAGLVWIVAGAFKLLGQSELSARLTAIAASLLALGLFFDMLRRWQGLQIALIGGLVYAVMPMNVYFGRMVNHEPYCMAAMLMALRCWQGVAENSTNRTRSMTWMIGFVLSVFVCAAIDWPGFLLAGLFCVYATYAFRRKRIAGGTLAAVWLSCSAVCLLVVSHIVYAGLDGRWSDLWAIFSTRSGATVDATAENPWVHTIENTSAVVLIFSAIGALSAVLNRNRPGKSLPVPTGGWVLTATGLCWVAVFWRQYRIHHYWMYYLGPCIAVLAALGICQIRIIASRFGSVVSEGSLLLSLLFVILATQRQSDAFFAGVTIPIEYVVALQHLHDSTAADVPVKLMVSPIREERFGGYIFRNITPPQLAWYLDHTYELKINSGRQGAANPHAANGNSPSINK